MILLVILVNLKNAIEILQNIILIIKHKIITHAILPVIDAMVKEMNNSIIAQFVIQTII